MFLLAKEEHVVKEYEFAETKKSLFRTNDYNVILTNKRVIAEIDAHKFGRGMHSRHDIDITNVTNVTITERNMHKFLLLSFLLLGIIIFALGIIFQVLGVIKAMRMNKFAVLVVACGFFSKGLYLFLMAVKIKIAAIVIKRSYTRFFLMAIAVMFFLTAILLLINMFGWNIFLLFSEFAEFLVAAILIPISIHIVMRTLDVKPLAVMELHIKFAKENLFITRTTSLLESLVRGEKRVLRDHSIYVMKQMFQEMPSTLLDIRNGFYDKGV
ncbi:MAG: hypothetical protein LBU60_03855 [Clostridiales bacterium]|nr:hypothetical protein [Clostridiales bacterium]